MAIILIFMSPLIQNKIVLGCELDRLSNFHKLCQQHTRRKNIQKLRATVPKSYVPVPV